jgi:LmbE family N-acetylglucosaminyl deacetylase
MTARAVMLSGMSDPHPAITSVADDVTALGTVLTVWAHPDDEAYLAGGVLAALRDAGRRAVCVTATRGEAADPAASPGDRAALAEVRTRELGEALAVLGVTEHHWLDHPDGGCAAVDPTAAAASLADLIDQVHPDTVITFGPDGFTGHPDHRAVSAWTDLAVRRAAAPAPRVLHAVAQEHLLDHEIDERFGVYELGPPRICSDDELALRVTLDGAALDRKVEALLRQVSQTADLVTAIGRDRFARWVASECFAPPVQSG